jgi:UDP-2,3-diacylglucosamine pyrophosphatase LpxH
MKNTTISSYRTVFLSDIHLGTRWCRAKELTSFLASFRCERLYLVGDVIDGWKLRKRPRWPRSHNEVVRWLLKMSKRTDIVYIPGNHDTFMDEFDGYRFGGISVRKEAVHTGADGRSFLVVHGDEFDVVVRCRKWLTRLGDRAYDVALWANAFLNAVRSPLGLGYWSLSGFLKRKVKDAVMYVGHFEDFLVRSARKRGVDGVICGHIHHPVIRNIRGLAYANCGDWIDSCSALVEHFDGAMEIVRWRERRRPGGSSSDGVVFINKDVPCGPALRDVTDVPSAAG